MREVLKELEGLTFEDLVSRLRDPSTAGSRGDVVYVLWDRVLRADLDCSSIVPDLIRCVAGGSFEEMSHAVRILGVTDAELSDDEHAEAVRALEDGARGAPPWRREAIALCSGWIHP